jgi:hypothetical protein
MLIGNTDHWLVRGILTGNLRMCLRMFDPGRRSVSAFGGGLNRSPSAGKILRPEIHRPRVGVQSFGGAQLLNVTPFQPFTQPIVRLDLDRMDDNDSIEADQNQLSESNTTRQAQLLIILWKQMA